jgi:scyllo-inositol 2-dehydrogenase (NADP+)
MRGAYDRATDYLRLATEAYGASGSQTARWYEWSLKVLGVKLAIRRGAFDEALQMADALIDAPGIPPSDAIQADLAVQREHGFVEDYFEVTLHYGAMRAILSAATIVPAPRPRFAVHGTAGSFVKSGLDPQEDALGTGMRPDDPEYGMDPPASYGTLTPPGGAGKRIITERGDYRQFYEGMAAAILDGASLPVDPADAVTGLRLIDHARRSAAEGRRITL